MVCALGIALSGQAEASSISLAWDAPPEQVTGYIVHYSTESGVYTLSVDAGNVTSYVATGLTTGQVYYFVVQAYNSAGTSPFSAQVSGAAVNQALVACTHTISPTSAAVVAAGGAGSVAVTTGSGCDWTATTNDTWITITAGATGSGSSTVSYLVAPNATTSSRTGTVTIGDQTLTVTQAGASCKYGVSPTSASVEAGGDSGTLTVTTGSGCGWDAASSAGWITVAPASGTGSGNLVYTVAPNASTSSRSGTITVGGQTFTVTQADMACSYTVSPSSASVPAEGGTGSLTVTTLPECPWTATSSKKWLSITPTSGAGSASPSYTAARNKKTKARTAIMTVEGQAVTVRQQGRPKGRRESFTMVADLDVLLQPGEAHALVLGPSSLPRGYVVEVNPLDPVLADIEAFVQPEFDGSEWNDVLRVHAGGGPGRSPVDANIRVYMVVAPTVLDVDLELQPDVVSALTLGPSLDSTGSYVVEVSPLSPSVTGASIQAGSCKGLATNVRIMCAAVEREFDGATWTDLLRVRYSAGAAAVNANIRVYELTTAPIVTEFELQLQPGVLQGVTLGPSASTQGHLVDVTPGGPSTDGAFVEAFVRPEFIQGTWFDVVRLQHSPTSSTGTALNRIPSGTLTLPADRMALLGQDGQNLVLLPALTAHIRARSIPLAPLAAQIASLERDVEDLVTDGALDAEQAALLEGQLDEVGKLLAQNQQASAVNLLRALINDMSDAVTTGVLTAAEGQMLVNAARAAVVAIERSP